MLEQITDKKEEQEKELFGRKRKLAMQDYRTEYGESMTKRLYYLLATNWHVNSMTQAQRGWHSTVIKAEIEGENPRKMPPFSSTLLIAPKKKTEYHNKGTRTALPLMDTRGSRHTPYKVRREILSASGIDVIFQCPSQAEVHEQLVLFPQGNRSGCVGKQEIRTYHVLRDHRLKVRLFILWSRLCTPTVYSTIETSISLHHDCVAVRVLICTVLYVPLQHSPQRVC